MKYIYCLNCRGVREYGACNHIQHEAVKHERKFEPYYDRVLGSWVSSWSDAEKKGLAHRSPSHPEGLRMIQGDRKYIKELKTIKKYKEDVKKSEWDGYKTGDKIHYDEARRPRGTVFSFGS